MGVFAPAASWPWDNTPTNEDGWRDMAGRWIPSTVLARDGGQLAVTIGSGLTVNVADGSANIRGHRARLAFPATLAIAPNTGPSTRTDRVVARADLVNNRVDLVVLGPTPSGGTAAPSSTSTVLQRTATVWDIPLASVVVPVGATAPASIVDERLLWSPDTGLQAWAATAGELTTLLQINYPAGPPDGLTIDALSSAAEQIAAGAVGNRTRLDPYTWDLPTSSAVPRHGPRWRTVLVSGTNVTADPTFPPQFALTPIGVILRGRVRITHGFGGSEPGTTILSLPTGAQPPRDTTARAAAKTPWLSPPSTWLSPTDALSPDVPSGFAGNGPANETIVVTSTGLVRLPTFKSTAYAAPAAGVYSLLIFDGALIPW